jgi:hypothetical protein
MKCSASLVVAMFAVLAVSAAWAESTGTRHHQGHHRTQAAPARTSNRPVPTAERGSSPSGAYAHPGDGDNDGLSRDPDDCNKGCIDGNPG